MTFGRNRGVSCHPERYYEEYFFFCLLFGSIIKPCATIEWGRKMKWTAVLLCLLGALTLTAIPSIAQPPDTLWTRTFGGVDEDAGYSIQLTDDGGYIVTGITRSYGAGAFDICVIKTDSDGNEVWTQTFGGEDYDWGIHNQQTAEGGFIIVGSTNSFSIGRYDVWLIKTDTKGNEIWSQTFGGFYLDSGYHVQQTSDSGYIVTGATDSFGAGGYDAWLVKTDSLGNETWSQTYGGTVAEHGFCVQQTVDGGYIITGSTESFGAGSTDLWLVKTDSDGNEVWTQTFGGAAKEEGRAVQQTVDGGYIITGRTASFGAGANDVWLIKTDSDGNEVWSQTLGGTAEEESRAVRQTIDGGYVIAGTTESFGAGSADMWLVKTDSSGNEIWNMTFGGVENDKGFGVQQTADGGYIVTGSTASSGAGGSDVYLIRMAAEDQDGTSQ